METLQNQIKYYILLMIRDYINKGIVSINSSDDLIEDLFFDPIDVKFLITKIENEFKILIFDDEFDKIKTISDISNLVIKKKSITVSE
jgi:acyl carrier protein